MDKEDARPAAVLIAGAPASGKSLVGASLAATLGAALIDLDVATEPLLSVIRSLVNVNDIDDPRLATLTRAARYETITCLAEENLRVGQTVLLVAPFTDERKKLDAWEVLYRRLHQAGGGAVTLVWLYLSREELLLRMRARGAKRDEAKLNKEQRFIDQLDLGPPVGPHLPIHAVGSVEQIVRSIVMQLKADFALPSTA
ncbi:MAG TPA: AAA family ATPase [Propionibacteriaceae bacterium]|nr:AAA family ATPase [Propionibacteriaceae bacterium]